MNVKWFDENKTGFELDGIKYYKLLMEDPRISSDYRFKKEFFCIHGDSECLGHLYLGSNANVICPKCGKKYYLPKMQIDCFDLEHNGYSTGIMKLFFETPVKYCCSVPIAQLVYIGGWYVSLAGFDWLNEFIVSLKESWKS